MPLPSYTKTFELDSGTTIAGWVADAGLSVDTSGKIVADGGTHTLAKTTSGAACALYQTTDSVLNEIVVECLFRFDTIGTTASVAQLIGYSSDPNPANILSPADNYRAQIQAITTTGNWLIARRHANADITIATLSVSTNPLASGSVYRMILSRRTTAGVATLKLDVQRVSDGFWFNPTSRAFQATRPPYCVQGTDSSPFTGGGYSGIRVSPASGSSIYADGFKVYPSAAGTYYTSAAGSDSNDGLTTGTPLLTIGNALSQNIGDLPGDTVNLRGGDTFGEAVTITAGRTFQSYGTGAATISFNGTAFQANDCDAVTLNNLAVANTSTTTGFAISFINTDSVRRAGGINLIDVDASGGLVPLRFGAASATSGGWNGISITRGRYHDSVSVGIITTETGSTHLHTHYSNIVIDGVEVDHISGNASFLGNGIVVGEFDATTGTNAGPYAVRNCRVHDCGYNCSFVGAGPAGIFPFYADTGVIEGNLVWNITSPTGIDGDALDLDINSANCTARNNFCYNSSGPGFQMFSDLGGHVVHDNIFVNCGTDAFAGHGGIRLDGIGSCAFFNNTVYMKGATNGAVYATSHANVTKDKTFYNNILISAGGATCLDFSQVTTFGTGFDMEGNAYQTTNGGFSAKIGATTYTSRSTFLAALAAMNGNTGPVVETSGHGFFATSSPISGYGTAHPTPTIPASMIAAIASYFDPSPTLTGAGLDIATLYSVARGTVDFKLGTLPSPYSVGAVSTFAAAGGGSLPLVSGGLLASPLVR